MGGGERTLGPSSCASASASAVLPVPGAPASSSARPAIFLVLISSTVMPIASRAFSCPTRPAATSAAEPSSCSPSPLTCECVATRCVRVVDLTSSIFMSPAHAPGSRLVVRLQRRSQRRCAPSGRRTGRCEGMLVYGTHREEVLDE